MKKEEARNTIAVLVERFEEQYDSYKRSDYSEALVRKDFIEPMFKALGWDMDNSQGYAEAYREVVHEDRVKVGNALKAPDYSFKLSGGKRLFFVEAKKQLKAYFSGKLQRFDLPLHLEGTEFQERVWKALRRIPHGKTLSYAVLAEKVGKPKASRAVGNANGKNPLPIIVPCHRVIAHNGGLGGYTGGLEKKRFLLKLEGLPDLV